MLYVFKEYESTFDTPLKRQQEQAIARKIMTLLNNKKYSTLDSFVASNQDYHTFLKNNNFENVVKHFGNSLNQEDYNVIIQNLKTLTSKKESFEKESIKETKIDNKEYVALNASDKTYYVDNTGQKPIEEQMKDLQTSQEIFQTSDPRKNADNMFKELHDNVKTSIEPVLLHQIDETKLNEDEKKTLDTAVNYQMQNGVEVKLDVNKGVMIDENENIKKINVEGEETQVQEEEKSQDLKNGYQKTLVLSPNN